MIFELGKGGDNAGMIPQIFRDQNVNIDSGANITVQPTGARAGDEIMDVMLIQERANPQQRRLLVHR